MEAIEISEDKTVKVISSITTETIFLKSNIRSNVPKIGDKVEIKRFGTVHGSEEYFGEWIFEGVHPNHGWILTRTKINKTNEKHKH